MDRSETALAPEWLKNSGSVTAGVANQSGSFFRSDDKSGSKDASKNPSLSSSGHDITQSSVPRTTATYLRRRDSSKDSANARSYDSINRNRRDRELDDFHGFRDKNNKDTLRQSQPMISRKSDWSLGTKFLGDSSNTSSSIPNSNQAILEQDFPSLRTKQGNGSGLRSAFSPGLNGYVQASEGDSSSVVIQDAWTSSLAEVASASTGSLLSQQTIAASSAPFAQRVNGLNMAEAVAQGPSRVRTPPQLSVDTQTQRLQELAIKLIPMTPKPMSPSPLDKPKLKPGQQQSQFFGNQTKTSSIQGKLQVLKSSREVNGGKDVSSSINDVISPLDQTPSGSAPNRKNPFSIQNPKEKRTSLQAQKSRSDFFNLIKKKSSASSNEQVTAMNTSVSDTRVENGVHLDYDVLPPPDEEESAFLHSLGWKEGSGEEEYEECLTEEEVNEFFQNINTRPPSELEGIRHLYLRLKNGRWGPI